MRRVDSRLDLTRSSKTLPRSATPGNRGVLVFRRGEGDVTHFVLTTLWDSLDAIRRFAGDDHERARYYAEDDEYLLEREPAVTHYEVLLATVPAPPPASGYTPRSGEVA
jgi:heme-degrading monooxygenase HmoA